MRWFKREQLGERRKTINKILKRSGHSHTTKSDGKLPLWKLILVHLFFGFEELVVTDHDYVTLKEGCLKTRCIKKLCDLIGMKIISGVELNSFVDTRLLDIGKDKIRVHIIRFDIGSDDSDMTDNLRYLAESRAWRSVLYLKRIHELNPELELPKRILKPTGVITSADIAKAVCELNPGLDYASFLSLMIKDERYRMPQGRISAKKAIASINKKSVWCHVVRSMKSDFGHFEVVADELKRLGLGGIEVFVRGQNREDTLRIARYCVENDLQMCISGDVHTVENLKQHIKEMKELLKDERLLPYLEAINN